jgi:hypothetical protein
VIEEAQSVLGHGTGSSAEEPYVTWVKEGRKYDLGAVLITQQPASIPHEILSQGDNWFVFHLLSSGDLNALRNANAHFSNDILSALLNEPIPGHCVFWSSVQGKTYPISTRIMSFENIFSVIDPEYKLPAGRTYARQIKVEFEESMSYQELASEANPEINEDGEVVEAAESRDTLEICIQRAQEHLRDSSIISDIHANGVPWMAVQAEIEKAIPDAVNDKGKVSYSLVRKVMNEILGHDYWDTERRPKKTGTGYATWIIKK